MTIISYILEEILLTTFTALSPVYTGGFDLFYLATVAGLTGLTGLIAGALTAVTCGSCGIAEVSAVRGIVHQQWVELCAVVLCAEGIRNLLNPVLVHRISRAQCDLNSTKAGHSSKSCKGENVCLTLRIFSSLAMLLSLVSAMEFDCGDTVKNMSYTRRPEGFCVVCQQSEQ